MHILPMIRIYISIYEYLREVIMLFNQISHCTEEDSISNSILYSFNKQNDEFNKDTVEHFCSKNNFAEKYSSAYLKNVKSTAQNPMQFIRGYSNQPDQVIIFTASDPLGTYNSVFRNNYWRAVYLRKSVVNLINNGIIKYFCLYQSRPKQYIEEYAEIVRINLITNGPDAGKYEFKLKNITQLPQKIHIGTTNPVSIMRGRRTTLNRLLSSTMVHQL